MANYYKVLGQSNPAATTNTDVYTVPAGRQAVISTISVTNLTSTGATCRIAIRVAGASIANAQYIAYDIPILGNEAKAFTLGIGLGAGDIITVYASNTNIAFSAFGTEIY